MRTMIAIPCMRTVLTPFLTHLVGLRKVGHTAYGITESTVIHDARDVLAKTAVEGNYDRVLWLDSDMTFRSDLMERLMADMDEGREMVTGLYFQRRLPVRPVIYEAISYDGETGAAQFYKHFPKDEIFEIAGCGFGGCITSVKLLRRVFEKYKRPFEPLPDLGEDLSFCWRVHQIGGKIWCNSFVKMGHIGSHEYTEVDYDEDYA